MTAYHPTDKEFLTFTTGSKEDISHNEQYTENSGSTSDGYQSEPQPFSPSDLPTKEAFDTTTADSGKSSRSNSYSSVKEDRENSAQSFLVTFKLVCKCRVCHGPNILYSRDVATLGACECDCGGVGSETIGSRHSINEKDPLLLPLESAGSAVLDDSPDLITQTVAQAGRSQLEMLPFEVLENIIGELALDLPPTDWSYRNVDLISCLLTSWRLHIATFGILYRHITISHPRIFCKFLDHVSRFPELGTMVRRLDLSHFTSLGLGRTQAQSNQTQYLTSSTLRKCLGLIPNTREVLLQEHVDQDIDVAVLEKLFYGMPSLRALDFCAVSKPSFVHAFSGALRSIDYSLASVMNIQKLSLHECSTIPSSDLEVLLSRLPQLRILDVHHTRITDEALRSIPITAKLTHLNLGRCTNISGWGVVDFMSRHPSVMSLVCLNLSCDLSWRRLLWEEQVEKLLPSLPTSLRSLNLSGAQIGRTHLSLIRPLTKHLEELSIAYADLSMTDISSFFMPPNPLVSHESNTNGEEAWTPSSLHYLDLTGVSLVTPSGLSSQGSILLGSDSFPLEVIEFGQKMIENQRKAVNTNRKFGWVIKDLGRRGWYVREPRADFKMNSGSRGLREWKMGCRWWGMRKMPVAWGEVGGLYGHYMYKK